LLSENVVKIRKDTLGANTLLRLGDAVRTLQFVFRLARFIRQQQPDIVHTNSLKSDIIGGLAGRLARRPVLWHVRDRIEPDYLPRPIVTLFRRLCRILPHYIIANSAATLDTLHLPPGKSQGTVYSGVDYKEFAQAQPAEEIVAIPSPRIGLVGRITPWKGQHIFLQAAAKLNLEFPGAQFVIVGGALFAEKEYEQEIKTLTNRLGLSHCVHFTGFRTDVARWIAGLDILAHASTSGEPFGQVIVQGMAAGKPVVATCGGGIPEIVVDGETGLLVPMNDAEALSQAIAALLRDPERARCMGERGQERVLEHFTIERTTRAMEEVYDAMLHHSKRA
jgi:glycosyltransferase involved in cell wall biosynthesis